MLKILGLALSAFLALSSSNVSATVIYHDLKFTVSNMYDQWSTPAPFADVSGEFIYTTGTEWVTPAVMLYSNLVIDNHVFDKVTVFQGASFTSFSQGSTTIGEDGLYFFRFGGNEWFSFTLAGQDSLWQGEVQIIDDGSGGEPFPYPVTPVPEPTTYAMVLLGLVLIAGVARRGKIQDDMGFRKLLA
jgi:hypothetical protein